MGALTTIIVSTIAGLAVLAIAGICKWFFIKKNSESDSDSLLEITIEEPEKMPDISDKFKSVLKIPELDPHIIDQPESVQKTQLRIRFIENVIEEESDAIDETAFAEALTELAGEDFIKADKVLAEIEERDKPTNERGSRIAVARGEIAQEQNRWKDAAEHYARGADLFPCFETLYSAQKIYIEIEDYNSAVIFSTKAKKAAIVEFGEKTEEHAEILGNLAQVYQELEKYKRAISIYKEALDIYKKIAVGYSPVIFAINNNLGMTYQKQGNQNKTIYFFKKALAIQKKMLGKKHPDTAKIINNIASVYYLQGRHRKATKLFKKAIKIRNHGLDEDNTVRNKSWFRFGL